MDFRLLLRHIGNPLLHKAAPASAGALQRTKTDYRPAFGPHLSWHLRGRGVIQRSIPWESQEFNGQRERGTRPQDEET